MSSFKQLNILLQKKILQVLLKSMSTKCFVLAFLARLVFILLEAETLILHF